MKEYGLALGGGAARGLAHIGVIKYLEEKDLKINEVSGTSMGAIIAAMCAIGKTNVDMILFANDISYLKLGDFDFKKGLLKGKKIESKLEEIFGDTKIEDTKITLKIVATNLDLSETVVFTKGRIVDALRASISLPGIFMPKEIDGVDYVDGGIMMNLPIEVLESENVIASSALKINTGKVVKTKNFLGLEFKTGIWKNSYETLKRSIIAMMKVNEELSLKIPGKNIELIRPDFGNLDIIDFDKVDEFVELGYNEAKIKIEI